MIQQNAGQQQLCRKGIGLSFLAFAVICMSQQDMPYLMRQRKIASPGILYCGIVQDNIVCFILPFSHQSESITGIAVVHQLFQRCGCGVAEILEAVKDNMFFEQQSRNIKVQRMQALG